ncbi:MAG: hypothetical protein KDB16_15085 [Acidimicrobiales bacterium]|nr:hypothetical protein [Acidimicrobiales bacterium]
MRHDLATALVLGPTVTVDAGDTLDSLADKLTACPPGTVIIMDRPHLWKIARAVDLATIARSGQAAAIIAPDHDLTASPRHAAHLVDVLAAITTPSDRRSPNR